MSRLTTVLVVTASCVLHLVNGEDSRESCEKLIRCMNEALDERHRCDNVQREIDQKWPPKQNDHQRSIAAKRAKVAEYDYARRTEKINCVNGSLENTTVISCDPEKQQKCSELLSSFRPRVKRQMQNGNATSNPPSKNMTTSEQKKQQAAAEAAAKREQAAAKREEERKRREEEKRERQRMQSELQQCREAASQMDKQCAQIASCCSESYPCDLKYQATKESTECAELKYELQMETRPTTCAHDNNSSMQSNATSVPVSVPLVRSLP